jgi:hypothetical protein
MLDEYLAAGRERLIAAAGLAHLHLLLRRHAFQHLVASQSALALRIGHLVQAMQLLDEPLLLRGSQAIEAGIVAQQPFLLIDRKSAVLVQPVAEMPRRSSAGIGRAGADNARIGRMTEGGTLRTGISWVAGSRTHSTVRLLIGPLLVLVRSQLILILRLLALVRPLLVLNLRLLVLIRSLLILIPLLILVLSLLILIPLLILVLSLLILVSALLILVLSLLILVSALLILVLAGSALLLARARLALTETRTHGWEGTEINSALSMRSGCGQAEEQDRGGEQTERQDRSGGQTERQDRSGGRGRRTHSFRVPGPVHKSFSRQVARI